MNDHDFNSLVAGICFTVLFIILFGAWLYHVVELLWIR